MLQNGFKLILTFLLKLMNIEITEFQRLAEEKKRKELEAREISDKKQKASKHSPF